MVETRLEALGDLELRYRDRTWKLTGSVDVRNDGELLAVEATRIDGSRRGTARLHFDLEGQQGSLNPGNLGAGFDRLERDGDDHYIVVSRGPRTYRYVLNRLEPT